MNEKIGTLFFRSVYLFVLWIVLSGMLDVFHLTEGLVCAVLIARLSLFYEPAPSIFGRLPEIPGIAWRGAKYCVWLLGRIFLAAIHVAKLILSRSIPITPEIIKHKTILKSDLEKVIFAHSITLTPGTITADITGETMTIHRLDEPSSDDIDSRVMEKKIQSIFQPKRRGS